jgi:hypothetical protein
MRKLLPLILSAGFLSVPAAIAATEDEADADANHLKPLYPVGAFEPVAGGEGAERNLRSMRRLAARERKRREAARKRQAQQPKVPAALQSIAACESGGDPRAIGGGGAYRGKYQFDTGTWASVGGTGDPAAASEAEQDRRALALYNRAGSSPWPVCG